MFTTRSGRRFGVLVRSATAGLALAMAAVPAVNADVLNWDVGAAGVPGSGTWDTTTLNWTTGAPTYGSENASTHAYTDGDDVVFATTTTNGDATITIQPGGVAPGSITLTGNANSGVSYTFDGGPLLGNGTLNVLTRQNTAGVGPITMFTTASPDWTGDIILGTHSATGPNLESRATGALGTGTIYMRGVSGVTNSTGAILRLGANSQTLVNDLVLEGGTGGIGASRQTISAQHDTNQGHVGFVVTLTGSITGNDDHLHFATIGTIPAGIVEIRPAAGKSVTGTGNTSVGNHALSISNNNQLLSGNLALAGGTLILDNLSYQDWGRTYGTGDNQWQITVARSGLAARGQDVTVTNLPTNILDSNIGLGYNDVTYADAAVKIQTGNTLTMSADRQLWVFGGINSTPNRLSGLPFIGPINEIADKIDSNGFTLTVGGNARAGLIGTIPTNFASTNGGAGLVRFSNLDNDIATLNIGADGIGAGAVVIANTGAAGGGTVNVGATAAGGFLYFEDLTGSGTTFTNAFNVMVFNTSGNFNNSGFGSVGGEAIFTGTATLTTPNGQVSIGTVGASAVSINVTAGSLRLGDGATPATIVNNRDFLGAYQGTTLIKNEAGEVILDNIDFSTGVKTSWRWQLRGGTITTASMGLIGSPGGLLSDTNLVPNDIVGQSLSTTSGPRTWRTINVNQAYVTNGGVNPTGDFTFDTQSDLTLDMGAASFFGNTAGAQLFRKTGAGTFTLRSTTGITNNGDVTDMFQIEAGTLDVHGNTGNTGFRIDGGTLLASHVSGLVSNKVLEITANGGKIGISTAAISNVTRTAAIDAWTQGGDVTFAARDNFDLVFANASFPDITAGTVRFERDGSGSGKVQLNDTAITVTDATIAGSGTLRLGAAGNGTLTLGNGAALAPGSSPGVLTLEGNITLDLGSSFLLEVAGVTPGLHDQLNIAGAVTLNGAELVLVGVPRHVFRGDMLTIINNDGPDAVLGTFANLNEGDKVFFAGHHFAFISYVGGTSNDVVLTIIPEPAAAALLLSLPILWRRRIRDFPLSDVKHASAWVYNRCRTSLPRRTR